MTFKVFVIYILSTSLALIIEMFIVGKENSTLFRLLSNRVSRSMREDILVWALDITGVWLFLGKVLTLGVTFLVAARFNLFVSTTTSVKFLPGISNLFLQLLVFLLLADFVGYWLHRLFHKVKKGWMLHKFHHSATELTIFTARRDNPLVVPFFVLLSELPVAIFGGPREFPLYVIFFGSFHALIIHSQISSDWGWIGRWVLVSPKGHKIHHSMNELHFDKNFAFMFPIWDRIFGSFYIGKDPVTEVGIKSVSGTTIWETLISDTCSAFSVSYKKRFPKIFFK